MIRAGLLAVALATSSSDVIALHFSMNAMACCAKAQNACARLKTPDDCCRSMGHGFSGSPSTMPDGRVFSFGPMLAVVPALDTAIIVPHLPLGAETSTFKRPHDPPHLHPVALLI
jgi:hypothetical protein